MVSTKRSGERVVITPDIAEPGKWRATRIDEAGPVGHTVFDSREDAVLAASGQGNSGARQTAITQYGQNFASNYYQNLLGNLMTLSGATSGSPAAAGQILANQNQSNQNAIGTFTGGITSGLTNAFLS